VPDETSSDGNSVTTDFLSYWAAETCFGVCICICINTAFSARDFIWDEGVSWKRPGQEKASYGGTWWSGV